MLVSLIVPVLNEEDAIPYFYEKVTGLRQTMSMDPSVGGARLKLSSLMMVVKTPLLESLDQ